MSDPIIVASFVSVLQAFSGCFTAPSMTSFVTLMAGWVLDLRRHTVTGVIRAAGAVRHKHISSYHRFFSRARWTTDEVGLTLDEAGWTLLCMPRHPLGDRARRVALEFAASGWHPQPGVLSARTPVGDASR